MNSKSTDTCQGPLATLNRRHFLRHGGMGLGAIAAADLIAREAPATDSPRRNPLVAKKPHFQPQAKAVIFLFMAGGPSQVETYDPKPLLTRLHGKPLPSSLGQVKTQRTTEESTLLGVKRKFRRHGQSGLEISDLFPHISTCADDMAIVRSMHADSIVHAPALYQMNSGRTLMGHPTLGSWLMYGLGSENENLPGYIVMLDPDGTLVGGPPCWGPGYFPPLYQGTLLRAGANPILNLAPAGRRAGKRQSRAFQLLRKLNALNRTPGDVELESRLDTYELAFRMQTHAPQTVDISAETKDTMSIYGIDNPVTAEFGRRCLLARRLVERGVRYIQLYSGGGPGNLTWDGHGDIEENHLRMAGQTDKPVAGLLKDLRQRGLLDDTLVIWGGEFGRTPMSQGSDGRDHSPFGFSMWLAGGGVQGGRTVGNTDEVGLRAVEKPYHVRDLHATILNQVGLDQEKLTALHNGREEKLTDTGGKVIREIL